MSRPAGSVARPSAVSTIIAATSRSRRGRAVAVGRPGKPRFGKFVLGMMARRLLPRVALYSFPGCVYYFRNLPAFVNSCRVECPRDGGVAYVRYCEFGRQLDRCPGGKHTGADRNQRPEIE